jgi:hypothetical protein
MSNANLRLKISRKKTTTSENNVNHPPISKKLSESIIKKINPKRVKNVRIKLGQSQGRGFLAQL